jgi:hypothetical protein
MERDRVLHHPESETGASIPGNGITGAAGIPRPAGAEAAPKIRAFDQKLAGGGRNDEKWARNPTLTGNGATHCKSFHCKLTGESLEFLDKQINDWLDAHPQVEVKFVTSTVGEWSGKLKEPNLIIQLWL